MIARLCDQCGAKIPEDDPNYTPPIDKRYVRVAAPYAIEQDFCGPRCLVKAFVGKLTTSDAELSDALVETVARVGAEMIRRVSLRVPEDDTDVQGLAEYYARAVLDALAAMGGER